MKDQEALYNKDLFVSFWCLYAKGVRNPFDVYKCMEMNKIGERSYVFYDNYSKDTEQLTRDFRRVDKIYRTGLDKLSGEAKDKLDKSYGLFTERMKSRLEDVKKQGMIMKEILPFAQSNTLPNNQNQKRERDGIGGRPLSSVLISTEYTSDNHLRPNTLQLNREKGFSYTTETVQKEGV